MYILPVIWLNPTSEFVSVLISDKYPKNARKLAEIDFSNGSRSHIYTGIYQYLYMTCTVPYAPGAGPSWAGVLLLTDFVVPIWNTSTLTLDGSLDTVHVMYCTSTVPGTMYSYSYDANKFYRSKVSKHREGPGRDHNHEQSGDSTLLGLSFPLHCFVRCTVCVQLHSPLLAVYLTGVRQEYNYTRSYEYS